MRSWIVAFLAAALHGQSVPVYDLSTFAGAGRFDLAATAGSSATLRLPSARVVATDGQGNLFLSDTYYNRVLQLTPDGQYVLFAGNGGDQNTGDGGPAVEASLNSPGALAFRDGVLYIGTASGIRAVSEGIIRTVVPGAVLGAGVTGLAVSSTSELYWSTGRNRILRWRDAQVEVVAGGNGDAGFDGDGGPAATAKLNAPQGLRFDRNGNLFIADANNHRIRRVRLDGVIDTYAGIGTPGRVDGPADRASFNLPNDIEFLDDGTMVVADRGNATLRRITPQRIVSTATGRTDGIDRMLSPFSLAPVDGFLLVSDNLQGRVYRVTTALDRMEVWAGSGPGDGIGDGGAATQATLLGPTGVAVLPDGSVLVSDEADHRIRKIAPDGLISTFAGNGLLAAAEQGVAATSVSIPVPRALAVDPQGNVYIASSTQIRKVDVNGIHTVFAGSGQAAFLGDGGPAVRAALNFPQGLAADDSGNLYIADTSNHRVRVVNANGAIRTIAGTGEPGFSGDGGPASSARLNSPWALAFDASGNLLILDRGNARVRRIDASGVIQTVAGRGPVGNAGDGGPAVDATLSNLLGMTFDPSTGNILLSALSIRALTPEGKIERIAGNATVGFSEPGPALNSLLDLPWGIAAAPNGEIYVIDSRNYRVRKLTPRQ